MEDPMAVPGMWFAFGLILLITAVVIVVIWQVFASQRAKAALARDEAYQKLAEKATEAQQRSSEDLADLRARVENIEKLLKEVE